MNEGGANRHLCHGGEQREGEQWERQKVGGPERREEIETERWREGGGERGMKGELRARDITWRGGGSLQDGEVTEEAKNQVTNSMQLLELNQRVVQHEGCPCCKQQQVSLHTNENLGTR
jgi:hypothetical protein